MTATLIVALDLAIVVALCVSAVQFWRERRLGSRVIRELAALSALVTLLIFVLIYSGSFLYQALIALRHWNVDPSIRSSVLEILRHFDALCTDIANAVNGALGAGDAGYRPEPPAWPAALLVIGYGIRFLIYRFQTRKGNRDSALTGAVYWSYITSYVMALAYLIVVAQLDAAVVVPISLALIAIVVVSVKVFVEDLGLTVRAIAKTVWTEVARAASRIAYLATEMAALVREALAYANRFYMNRIRTPLRKGIDALEARNRRTREDAERRLAEQNAQHAERFRESAASSEDPPPS
jgi:hypothetical protein